MLSITTSNNKPMISHKANQPKTKKQPQFSAVRLLSLASVHPILGLSGISTGLQLTFIDSTTGKIIPLGISYSTHSRSVLRRLIPQLFSHRVSNDKLREPYKLLCKATGTFYHAVVTEPEKRGNLKIESLVPATIANKTIYNQ
jgi:hypothetical protein